MANGASSSLFKMDVDTTDPSLNNLDVINVTFINNENIFTVADNYKFYRTCSTDNTVTFSAESLEFLNLDEVDNGLIKIASPFADSNYTTNLSFNDTPLMSIGLGYYNEDTGKWECEDECLEPNGVETCGTTDHF